MWCLCPRDGGKPFSETSAGNWVLCSTLLAQQKECDSRRASHARPGAHLYHPTPEASGRLGDRLSEREERYRHRQDVRQGEKLFRRALLAAATRCPPSASNWSRCANTSASKNSRMATPDSFKSQRRRATRDA